LLLLLQLNSKDMGQNSEWIYKENAASFEVRVGDINYGNHMGNDKSLLIFHDARLKFLESLGFSEKNIGGPGIIMRDAHVSFRKEVYLHDELTVDVGIENVSNSSFEMIYTVRRIGLQSAVGGQRSSVGSQQSAVGDLQQDEGEVVFTGSTGLVAFDYESKRPVRLPEEFLRKIAGR
jgi:acyl-CoA thioester hydrolase